MLKKLDDIKKRYEFLSEKLADNEVIADMGTWQKYSKEQSDLTETVEKYDEYLDVQRQMTDAFALAETETDADVHTSAVTGEGIERLKALLFEKGFGERGEDAAFLIEQRHFDALQRAGESLHRAITACQNGAPLDLIGIDVKEAWDALGEITGETATEAIIEEIFSKFCVGK